MGHTYAKRTILRVRYKTETIVGQLASLSVSLPHKYSACIVYLDAFTRTLYVPKCYYEAPQLEGSQRMENDRISQNLVVVYVCIVCFLF